MIIATTAAIFVALSVRSAMKKPQGVPLAQILPTLIDVHTQNVIEAGANKETVLILFNSTCEYCHFQSHEIRENISLFKDKSIIFVSPESVSTIRAFADSSNLNDFEQVLFAHMDMKNAVSFFESLTIPTLYFYGTDGLFKKKFDGESTAEAIIKQLK